MIFLPPARGERWQHCKQSCGARAPPAVHTRTPAGDASPENGSRQRQLTTVRWPLASVPIPLEPASQAPASSVCDALVALTLDAMAESLSAAEGLRRLGRSKTSPNRLDSLAALRTRLACTLGVGRTHGCTSRQRVVGLSRWMASTRDSALPS